VEPRARCVVADRRAEEYAGRFSFCAMRAYGSTTDRFVAPFSRSFAAAAGRHVTDLLQARSVQRPRSSPDRWRQIRSHRRANRVPVAVAATGRAKAAVYAGRELLEAAGVLLPMPVTPRKRTWEVNRDGGGSGAVRTARGVNTSRLAPHGFAPPPDLSRSRLIGPAVFTSQAKRKQCA
jgi:hypothetical protein